MNTWRREMDRECVMTNRGRVGNGEKERGREERNMMMRGRREWRECKIRRERKKRDGERERRRGEMKLRREKDGEIMITEQRRKKKRDGEKERGREEIER